MNVEILFPYFSGLISYTHELDQIIDFFRELMESQHFMPRWVCGKWTPFHGWLYVISDVTIFLAYMAIPVAMVYFVRKRWADLPFKHVFWLFIAFIGLCGTTHLVDAIIFWWPVYRLNAVILMLTAIVSVVTVVSMLRVIPLALAFRSPTNLEALVKTQTTELAAKADELADANEKLKQEIDFNKHSQNELARLAAIVQSSDDSIVSLSEDGTIVSWNHAAEKLYGYSEQEALGRNMRMLYLEDNLAEFEKVLQELRNGNTVKNFETERLTKHGGFVHVAITYSPIRNTEGEITGISGIARDISAARESQRQKDELLRQLEKTNRELESFAYITSHDLKAPLRAIGSLSDWLYADYSEQLGEQGKEHLQLLKGRVQRMHELIDGILSYSRIGRKDGTLTDVNVGEVINEVLQMIKVPENFHVKIQSDMPTVRAYHTHITQIFENLISNAIKYNDKEVGLVEVGFEEIPRFWKFWVKDNGVGVEARYQKKIFEIFQTLKSRDEVEGTGIGLTIVKKIVENAKGDIWIVSEPGKGTEFHFTISKERV